jgi:TP901 family phage tail tape measure protein
MQQGLGVFVDVIGKDSLSGPAAAAGASLLGIEKSAGSLGNVLAGVEKGIAGVAVAVTASVATIGAALTTLAVVGVKQAGELQQAVANISSIKPEINTQGVFSSLNLMQTRVAQSAKDMGAALYNLFSSIDATAEQGLALVEKFGRGAVASMTDAQTFGTAILGEMNAFKTGVEATDHLMDIFFNTVKVGVVTGQELAANLGLVAQNAKVAGVSVEELGGFIAGVTKEGGSAAQNINNLSNLFQKIVTKEAAAGFKELGVQVADATGKFRPIIDVLTDTRRVLTTYTESAAAAALQKIFPDLQARQGALVIMNELSTVRAAIEENQQSTGAASDAYEKMVGTFENQTKLLRQSFDSVLTSVGAGLLPVLSSVTSSVQGFVKDTAPLFDAWQNRLQDAFKTGGFKPWLTEVGNVAGELGREIEKWIPPFTNWVGEAQKILGKTLTDVYDGTIVPWVTQRATDLKAKFETEWVPAVVDWWSSPETQGKLTGALDILGDTVKSWAGEGGYGNAAVKEAGVSLGTALVNSFQQQAVDVPPGGLISAASVPRMRPLVTVGRSPLPT